MPALVTSHCANVNILSTAVSFFPLLVFVQGKQQNYFLKYFFCIFIIHLVSYAVLAGASFVILKMCICP